MKQFKNIIKIVIGILVFIAGLYLMKTFPDAEDVMKVLPYLLIGVGCGIFGHGVGEAVSASVVRKNPELARQIEIEQKDERNILLAHISKAKAFDMMTYVMGALLLAYALMGASVKIIIPFVIAYLFVQFYFVYWRLKIDKKI